MENYAKTIRLVPGPCPGSVRLHQEKKKKKKKIARPLPDAPRAIVLTSRCATFSSQTHNGGHGATTLCCDQRKAFLRRVSVLRQLRRVMEASNREEKDKYTAPDMNNPRDIETADPIRAVVPADDGEKRREKKKLFSEETINSRYPVLSCLSAPFSSCFPAIRR